MPWFPVIISHSPVWSHYARRYVGAGVAVVEEGNDLSSSMTAKNMIKRLTSRVLHFNKAPWKRLRALIAGGRTWRVSGRRNTVCIEGQTQNVSYDIDGNDNRVLVQANALLSNVTVFIRGNNNTLLVSRGVRYLGGSFRFEGNNCTIEIGENTTVVSASLQAIESNRQISIGKQCMLGMEVSAWTSDFHTIIDRDTKQRINSAQDIILDDHVWVGAYVLILKGVHVGRGSVIGARSVVTKDVPPHVVAAGSPARVVREGVDWNPGKDAS